MENKTAVNIIIDLYEMRVSTFNKYMEKSEKILDASKYNFFNMIIATLQEKYHVTHDEIQEELRERSRQELLDKHI